MIMFDDISGKMEIKMEAEISNTLLDTLRLMFRAHPWHGVPIGESAPEICNTYIEVTPTDTMKYEMHKVSGHLRVDRPQRFSNICPALYGLIPQTYCTEKTAEFCMEQTGFTDIEGDGDPLDICVLTEKDISHGDIFLSAIPIGGLRMIDGKEADDKIIAVLRGDAVYGKWKDIRDCPSQLINRLKHYFLTYKDAPGSPQKQVMIPDVYGREEAHQVIKYASQDYINKFGNVHDQMLSALSRIEH